MEALDQNFGYTLYESKMLGKRNVNRFKVVDASDRVQIYVNDDLKTTQYNNEIGQPISFELTKDINNLQLLVENLSRNNYGPKIVAPTQYKGIRGGVMEDIHFISNWNHYSIDFESIESIDFSKDFVSGTPSFYEFEIDIDTPVSTFIDTSHYGKGLIFINGFNLGRYWNVGPTQYLYVPSPLWKKGKNKLVVFETEGTEIKTMTFSDDPIYGLSNTDLKV